MSWPAQRAVGALARAGAVTLGALPAVLGGALHEGKEAIAFLPVVAVFAVAAFALERRDATVAGTAWRLAAAAIVGALLAPFAVAWCAHAGDPEGGLREIDHLARALCGPSARRACGSVWGSRSWRTSLAWCSTCGA